MNLKEMKITDYANLLASDAPAPGGGSAAALIGALGVALTSMVAALTMGKKKYEEHQSLMEEIFAEAAKFRGQLTEIIDKDTEVFNGLSAVYAMPKGEERTKAMQEALKNCTIVPFEMMECSLSALEMTEKALGRSNTNAISDIGVAALALKAAVQSAWLNIVINVGSIKDEEFSAKYKKDGEAILAKALPLADKIYAAVLEDIQK